ncbi:hypothetical protein CHLNCDRAFT_136276 [Chlorella variabilis]|uniref:Uncharacterized protein n=1 Tax=Chlorella variabilis TaxID=554065 RepID=E1ZUC9_CHLVA|nr:hypothetical protein CHLNCDRAFT_136276 [Chlorella variabilis]EFN50565.1 hypothetical protein CHLNCDRAFT_136276 [Chlorella variabilis]|eukprot:XP_005842697.1 hypothetical protein CHLNCDRAFT_136276 [Chlorella variabilis]
MERVRCSVRAASKAPALPAVRVVGFAIPTHYTRASRAQRSRVHAAAQVQDAAGAASAAASGPAAAPSAAASSGSSDPTFNLACPICLSTKLPLRNTQGRPTGSLSCPRCNRTFASTPTYADLTLTSGIQQKAYQQSWWGGTTIFRSPLVSFVYERGWRQGFAWAGFPGADKEFELAMDYLQHAGVEGRKC